jgi:hypothetical protein
VSDDQGKTLSNIKTAVYFILAFTVVNLLMLAYDTRAIYSAVTFIHRLGGGL